MIRISRKFQIPALMRIANFVKKKMENLTLSFQTKEES